MKIFKSIILSGALVACAASAAPTTPAPKPLSFRADAKVEVDSDGKLVKVEASPDLPEGVRRYIEQEVSKWTFKRNPREGEAGNAISYIDLGACAVPTPTGGYSMGLAMHGNGPRIAGGGKWWIAPELQSVVGRYELDQTVTVHFAVQPDGSAKFVSPSSSKLPKTQAANFCGKIWICPIVGDASEAAAASASSDAVTPALLTPCQAFEVVCLTLASCR